MQEIKFVIDDILKEATNIDAHTINGLTVEKSVPADAKFTDTTYTIGDGGLTEVNFSVLSKSKLDSIEPGAEKNYTLEELNQFGITASNVNGFAIKSHVPENAKFTDTIYTVGDEGLTEKNFTKDLHELLNSVQYGATANLSDVHLLNRRNHYGSLDIDVIPNFSIEVDKLVPIKSVNDKTGAVVIDADDISDFNTSNKFISQVELEKLTGIESGATADLTGAEIRTLLQAELNTNILVDADKAKLDRINVSQPINLDNLLESFIICCSDESSDLTTGTKVTFRMPYAFTLNSLRASLTNAPTGSNLIVDVEVNGNSILSTKLSIDEGEKTSTTSSTPAIIFDNSLSDDSEVKVNILQVGSEITGTGLKITFLGFK